MYPLYTGKPLNVYSMANSEGPDEMQYDAADSTSRQNKNPLLRYIQVLWCNNIDCHYFSER